MADNTQKLLLQIDASTELLRRHLSAGDAQVAAFERDTNRRINSIDRNFAGLGKGLGGFQSRFNSLKGAAAAIGVGFSVGAIVAATARGLEYASSLGEMSQQLGVTTKDLQVYRYAASQAGIEQDTMDKGIAKLTQTIGKAATGGKAQGKAFAALGIDIRNVNGDIKTAGEVFPEIADALATIPSPAKRAAVEVALFGKAGQQLDTLLAGGSAQINGLAAAAENLGLILSDEQIQKADETADKISEMKQVLEARIAGGVADNASAILVLVDSLVQLVSWAGKAALAWKVMNLEWEARGAQKVADGLFTSPERRLKALQRVSDIRGEIVATLGAKPKGVEPRRTAPPRGGIDLDELSGPSGGGRKKDRTFTSREQAIGIAIGELETLGFRVDGNRRSRGGATVGHANNGEHNRFAADVNVGKGSVEANDPAQRAKFDTLAREYQSRGFRVIWNGEVYEPGASGPGGKASGHRDHLDIKAPASIVGKSVGGGTAGTEAELYQAGERAAQEAEEARKKTLRDDFQIASDRRTGQAELLRAEQELTSDYIDRAALALRILDIEKQQEQAAITQQVQLGEITLAQADEKMAQIGRVDALKRQKVNADEQAQRAEQYARFDEDLAELQKAKLEREVAGATTAKARRAAELRLLDLVLEQERIALQAVIDSDASENDKAIARRKIGELPEKRDAETGEIIANTRGPIEEARSRIPQTAAEIDEALEAVAAGGLRSLEDGIVDAIMGAKSLGDVFKAVAKQIIADLIRIAVQRAIIGPLADALFPGSAGNAGSGSGAGAGGAIVNFLGGLLKGGRASGGPVSRNDLYMVGERGPELFVPSVSGKIIANDNLRRSGGGGRASAGAISLTVNAPGATAETVAMIRRELANAAPMIVEASMAATMRAQSRPRL